MPKRFLYGHLVCAPAETQASPKASDRSRERGAAALSLSRIVLENARSVECRSGITGVKHDDSDAKVIESLDVDRFKPEGAVAMFQREFRRASQHSFASKGRSRRIDV